MLKFVQVEWAKEKVEKIFRLCLYFCIYEKERTSTSFKYSATFIYNMYSLKSKSHLEPNRTVAVKYAKLVMSSIILFLLWRSQNKRLVFTL